MILKLVSLFLMTAAAVQAVDLATLARHQLVLPETIMSHAGELGFSPEQEAKLKAYQQEMKPKIAALEATVRDEQAKLEQAIKAPEATAEQAAPQLDKLLAAESAVKHAQLKILLELRDMLTPQQRELALSLARKESEAKQPLEQRVKAKASRLKAAFDELGIPPADVLKAKGAGIAEMVRAGDYAEAETKLDELAKEVAIDEPALTVPSDFSKFEPGNTDLDVLKQRYESVSENAKDVVRLPVLKALLKGRDALEKAKAAEDADAVARILTWAEGVLGIQP